MADTLGFSNLLDSDEEDDPVLRVAKMAADEADRQAQRQSSDRYQYHDSSSELRQAGDTPYDVEGGRAKDEDEAESRQKQRQSKPVFQTSDGRGGTRFGVNQWVSDENNPAIPSSAPTGSKTAKDGQTFSQQSVWTQSAFRHQYGAQAEQEWVRQHEVELDKNQQTYGSREPTAGTAPLASAPQGTPNARDRRIGAEVPPASTVGSPTAAPLLGPKPPVSPTELAQATAPTSGTIAAPDAPTTFGAPTQSTPPATASPTPGARVNLRSKLSGQHISADAASFGPGKMYGSDVWELDPDFPQADTAATPSKMSARTSDPVLDATSSATPIDTLVRMSGKPPEESQRVLTGIGALLKGDVSASWAEPYLNDVARLAWAKQEQSQGRNADPRDTPQNYIESWKDAFFGSDTSIPLVKELDQQMIDHAVDIGGGPSKPFNWKEAFGPTGEGGLISRQVASNDCGPNAASVVLRSFGYNVDPAQMFEYAKSKGYHDGEQFTGPNNMARMLTQETGLQAQAAPIDWSVIDQNLDTGRVVLLSSGGHYWAVSARRDGPNGPEYYTGATGSVVGNPDWSRAGAIRYGGAPSTMIVTGGQVDPNSRAVQTMGLKPPTGSGPDRSVLSLSTKDRMAQRITSDARRGQAQTSGGANNWSDIAWKLAQEEGADPILIQAVMGQESGGDPNTPDSYAGARGPMQLMPAAAAEVGVNRDDPIDNTRGGIRYLKKMLDRYHGDVPMALAAYNAGPGKVDATGGIPQNGETEIYVPAVLARYKALQEAYGNRR